MWMIMMMMDKIVMASRGSWQCGLGSLPQGVVLCSQMQKRVIVIIIIIIIIIWLASIAHLKFNLVFKHITSIMMIKGNEWKKWINSIACVKQIYTSKKIMICFDIPRESELTMLNIVLITLVATREIIGSSE